MMKDRIGNGIEVGDKVMVSLPEPSIIGFISQIEDSGIISNSIGRVLVSCVIALPVDSKWSAVPQLVKVYDAEASMRAEKMITGVMDSQGKTN